MGQPKVDSKKSSGYQIMVELFAAKDLVGSKLKFKPDPYAIITCGNEKRFSSIIPGSRIPLWGEDFNFYVHRLPVQINVAIYDWNIFTTSISLGSVTVPVESECRTVEAWHALESPSGQVTIRIETQVSGNISRMPPLETHGPSVAHEMTGPLQTIFGLHPNEVVDHRYTCALQTLILYQGHMYVSARHICFYSNVLNKKMKVVIPLEDIDKIQKSQLAGINPAITIVLRPGAGGRGVPPLKGRDNCATYMFASFWNRNRVLEDLRRAEKNFNEMLEVEKITYHGALLEVCMKKLASYPEVASFIKYKNDQFPSVKVCDVFKSPPKLIMLDNAGQREETIRIDDWKREHIVQFLREKVKPLAAD